MKLATLAVLAASLCSAATVNICSTAACNGTTDDTAAVQAAINGSSSGDAILWATGTTKVTSVITALAGRTYQGTGGGGLTGAFSSWLMQCTSCTNTTVTGLKFNGGGFLVNTSSSSNFAFTNNTIQNITTGSDYTMDGLHVWAGLSGLTVSGNSFTNIYDSRSTFSGACGAIWLFDTASAMVTGNTISLTCQAFHYTANQTDSNLTITNNIIHRSQRYNIEVQGSFSVNNQTITGNYIDTPEPGINGQAGISSAAGGTGNVLSNNTLWGPNQGAPMNQSDAFEAMGAGFVISNNTAGHWGEAQLIGNSDGTWQTTSNKWCDMNYPTGGPSLIVLEAGGMNPGTNTGNTYTTNCVPAPITTTSATLITATTASAGGTVLSNGGSAVTSEGTCYGTSANPTTPCTSDGTSSPFTSSLTGLSPSTLYHYRAFATNSVGTYYGFDMTFTTNGAPPSGCTTVAPGICNTGLSAVQNNLLGPLTPIFTSPWTYSDLAEVGTAAYMAPQAIADAPALGTALSGTVSFVAGNSFLTTTTDLTGPLSGQTVVIAAWTTVDGSGTGRLQCPILSVTSTQINCSENPAEPSFTGASAYLQPVPSADGCTILCWTVENPTVSWNYYDVSKGLFSLHYRYGSSDTTYIGYARQYADINWQWVIDHGYRSTAPRAGSMVSQFFRALDGHPERFPGLYNWINLEIPPWASPAASPNIDNREAGYMLWDIALGAKTDTDPTRHAQYCTWLSTYTASWNSVQAPDGSFPENEYYLNQSYVSAPKSFTPPFTNANAASVYQGAPWREAINVRSLEAAYESLLDTSSQGCNNPTLAATTLTTITNAVTWQNNYGRDTSNRGISYEVNSQSADQNTVGGTGTVSVNLGSTALSGSGTNWSTAGYCDGTHFLGFRNSLTIYKIASCSSDVAATLSVAYGIYGESSNLSASNYDVAPAAFTGCHSSATYCFGQNGDRNLTRVTCAGFAWLYAQTLNATYKNWGDECFSATLGGPTAGLNSAANLGSFVLPCSGSACDGLVTDIVEGARNCSSSPPPTACLFGVGPGNLGKNYGEGWGAPGIDNELGWRLASVGPGPCSISPTTLGPWTNTQVISQTLTTTCGGMITWTSSGLPIGLAGCNGVTGTSCVLSGTLTVVALYSATITATGSNVASVSPSIIVNIVPAIGTMSLPGAVPGTPYSQSLMVSGGTSPLACSLSSGTLAGSGLTLNPSACTIIGTPTTTVAAYVFTARVTDANGIIASRPLSIAVGSPCDLNGDGIVNVQDTQLAVNMSLSIIPCTANINGPGVCDSVTISRVVTASLGGACVVGP